MVKIIFNDLKIDEIAETSGVFSGTNIHVRWKHAGKTNEGFGRVSGDGNSADGGVHVLSDRDLAEHVEKQSRP